MYSIQRFVFKNVRLLLCATILAPALAHASPEEVQVYMDEMNEPGEFGLDLHNNLVVSGSDATTYLGEQPSLHRYRFTPEFSYGLTKDIEFGAYLPMLTRTRNGAFSSQGVKFRIKYIAPHAADSNSWWGLNYEFGRSGLGVDENPWNSELKGIVGTKWGKWLIASNINLDSVMSGPHPGPVTLDVDVKVSYSFRPELQAGFESYNGLGPVRRIGGLSDQDQIFYAVVDSKVRHWDINFGIGHGYGSSLDRWVVKAIIGVPLR